MKQFTRYIFLFLIFLLIYMIFLVIRYMLDEYRVEKYIQDIKQTNLVLQERIRRAHIHIDIITSESYKNKILKSELWWKNTGEEVVILIGEDAYNKYSDEYHTSQRRDDPLLYAVREEQSLISTMTVYQKWIYFIFQKDIR